jgi:hypothetical protein
MYGARLNGPIIAQAGPCRNASSAIVLPCDLLLGQKIISQGETQENQGGDGQDQQALETGTTRLPLGGLFKIDADHRGGNDPIPVLNDSWVARLLALKFTVRLTRELQERLLSTEFDKA